MSENVYEILAKKDIFLQKIRSVDLSLFTRKRSLKAWIGVDLKGYYTFIFIRFASTRLLKKESIEINNICSKFEESNEMKVKKRILFYTSHICSKALSEFKNSGWKCHAIV